MHHHISLRKRLEPYPARKFWLRLLDRTVLVVGTLGPLMTLPQIILIYAEKSASGVSPFSWGAWALLDIPWIIYGLVHRDKPIVSTYALWFVANVVVCIGAVLYG